MKVNHDHARLGCLAWRTGGISIPNPFKLHADERNSYFPIRGVERG